MGNQGLKQDYTKQNKHASLYSPVIKGKQGNLYCTLHTAGGRHLHPVVILLHGFPGHEKNADLAQLLRQMGFHVLSFSYSGSWGSQGTFSFLNSFTDTEAVLDFILQDCTYGFDKHNIFVVGHSMGAVFAANMIVSRPEITGGALLMPCDLVALGREGTRDPDAGQVLVNNLEEGLSFLNGVSREELIGELIQYPERFSLTSYVRALADKPLLWLSGKADILAPESICTVPFMNALKNCPRSRVCWRSLETDHFFSDKRSQVGLEIVNFFSSLIEHKNATINYSTLEMELAELIEWRYRTLTIKDVAAYFSLSVSHISALIKQQTGSTFSELLTRERLKQAAVLLQTTTLPIFQVASFVGYDNSSYFMRIFKLRYGCTPTEFRLQSIDQNADP